MKTNGNELKYILTSHKQRITKPRIDVLKVLSENGKPLTISEIHSKIKRNNRDLATVYRIVKLYLELKILAEVDFREEFKRYELVFDRNHHHHIVCNKCGKVEDINICEMDEIEKSISGKGYKDISHSLEFFGTCPICNKVKK